MKGHKAPVQSLSFFENKLLVSGDEGGLIRVWDPRRQKSTHACVNKECVNCATMFSEFDLLCACGTSLSLFDLRKGAVQLTSAATIELCDEINLFDVSKNKVACPTDDGKVTIVTIGEGELSASVLGGSHDNISTCAIWAPSRKRKLKGDLISGGMDAQVLFWDTGKRKTVDSLSIALSQTAPSGASCQVLNPPFVYAAAHLPRLHRVAFALGDGSIAWAECVSRKISQRVAAHTACVGTLHCMEDHVLSGGNDCKIALWSVDGECKWEMEHSAKPNCVCSDGGDTVFICDQESNDIAVHCMKEGATA